MRRFLKVILVCLTGLVVAASPSLAQDDISDVPQFDCGNRRLSIAQLQWPSAAVLAHIHFKILKEKLGCNVEVVPGDLRATTSSMATTGQPAIVPEMWLTRIADVWNPAVENASVRQAGPTYSGAPLEGWFIPSYVRENHPDLTSIAQLKDYWQVFRPQGTQKAQFISCPKDWACAVINRNLLKALGLTSQFEIIEPENRFEMDGLLAEAVSSRRPVLFYYWQPNAVLSQLNFMGLDMGLYDAEAAKCLARRFCADAKPSAFVVEPVVAALSNWVFAEAPDVAGYFQRAQMPVAEMNALLAWQSEQGALPDGAAQHFVETRSEIWQAWVGGN